MLARSLSVLRTLYPGLAVRVKKLWAQLEFAAGFLPSHSLDLGRGERLADRL